jgi:hypothetical protein
MTRITRIAATLAATASLAAVAAAPASAQEIYISEPPCDSVPSCVNYTLDTAERVRQTAEDAYNNTVQPLVNWGACTAYYVVTGKPCT